MAKPKEQKKAADHQVVYKARYARNANYDAIQDEPSRRMGEDSFANLPDRPMFGEFMGPTYRDGIVNSHSAAVSFISGIEENRRNK